MFIQSNYVRFFWAPGHTAPVISHAIPSWAFHGVRLARWNFADCEVVLVWGGVELHATVGWLGLDAGG